MAKFLSLLITLLFPLMASAYTNIPSPIASKLLVVIGDYNPDMDGGHPSAMGGIFGVRAPADWQYVYSGVDYKTNGTTCWGWTGSDYTWLSRPFVDRCVSSNVAFVQFHWITQWWIGPDGWPGPNWYEGVWDAMRYAASKGLTVFIPFYNNADVFVDKARCKCPITAISVGSGMPSWPITYRSYGPALEFIDCKDEYDTGQSWANQATAARFARISNMHTNYNSFDIRAGARMANYSYPAWTNRLGYGFIHITNRVDDPPDVGMEDPSSIEPQPPLETWVVQTNGDTYFFFENYLQTGWQSTVIKKAGSVLYEGPGSNIVWTIPYTYAGSNYTYDVVLNGYKRSGGYFNTNEFEFHSRVSGTLSSSTPYSKVTLIGPPEE